MAKPPYTPPYIRFYMQAIYSRFVDPEKENYGFYTMCPRSSILTGSQPFYEPL